MRQKRGPTEIIADILKAASGQGVTKTSLVYRANLNFTRIEKYIQLLTRKSMLELYRIAKGNEEQPLFFYRTTRKGTAALRLLLDSNNIVFGNGEIEDEDVPSIIA